MTEPGNLTPVHRAALAFAAAGCSVVPARADGSKAPAGDWKRWQTERPSVDDLNFWFSDEHPGLGVVCGEVSGNLLMLEMEGRAVNDGLLGEAVKTAMAAGDADLWRRITRDGYLERTPSGGLHILYRIADGPMPGNQKLARRPGPQPNTVEVLAETRGAGGFTVVAPSGGTTHPSGQPWTVLYGSPATIPTITHDEHVAVCSILRSLDQMPAVEISVQRTMSGNRDNDAPGDDFNQRHAWADVLGPHGWTAVRQRGQIIDWCRPGKTHGISATTGYGEHDLLYVFSTSTPFDSERSYSKFAAYAVLEHQGSFADAARQLRREGYGAPRDPLPPLQPFVPEIPWQSTSVSTGLTPYAAVGEPGSVAVAELPAGPASDPLAARRAQLETNEYEQIRARDTARRRYDAEIVARDFREPAMRSLEDELALPDEDVLYRVDQIMPVGANVVLTAKYKTGKTTTIGQFARVLADGGRFLHKFNVTPIPAGRTVCIFNYELSEGQYRRWLRDLGVVNQKAISVVHLRGITLPLVQAWAQDKVCGWLERFNAAVWVVDPFARAMTGSGDENVNRDVGEFVAILDEIKQRTGVSELVMPAHTGRGNDAGDRTRGATRLNDWADVQWLLTKNDENTRFFSADGRDVDVAEEKLTYDEKSRSYVMAGGDKAWEERRGREWKMWKTVEEHPGIKAGDLQAACSISNKPTFLSVRDYLEKEGYLRTEPDGASTRHHVGRTYVR